MKLFKIFSSNSIYQQNAGISFKGTSEYGKRITASLFCGEQLVRSYSALCGKDGVFSVRIDTPAGSFTPYKITFSDGSDEVSIDNVLFGEVWIAAGQSNMEMKNNVMGKTAELYRKMKAHKIRYYAITDKTVGENDYGGEPYPFEPCADKAWGMWFSEVDGNYTFASACASEAILKLAEYLDETGCNVPVGLVDISHGGTTIESWLPIEYCENQFKETLSSIGRYVSPENRNKVSPTGYMFHQQSVMYNIIVYPVLGIKARGLLWYQGCSNVSPDHAVRDGYKKLLEGYHKIYKNLFATDEKFPMICSLLYPFIYGVDAEVRMGYINEAMSDAARECEEISAFPIHNLPSKWAYFYDYHPIHPANKYEVGDLFAKFVTNTYGKKNGIRTAAYLKDFGYRRGGAIELRFETFGKSLYCEGSELRGFYIAGKNGTYIPAEAEIISKNKVRITSGYIKSPKNVSYMMADLQDDGNLFCDGAGVMPFSTDKDSNLTVGFNPWTRPDTSSVFYRLHIDDALDMFNYPVRHAEAGTEFCYDTAYNATRIVDSDEDGKTGIYFLPTATMPIDLHLFKGFEFTAYCRPEIEMTAKITAVDGNGKTTEKTVPVAISAIGDTGELRCSAKLNVKSGLRVTKFALYADISKLKYKTFAIGKINLIPKAN